MLTCWRLGDQPHSFKKRGGRSPLAGTGKSRVVIALGHAAADGDYTVRYFAAEELVESLYRGLADNSVDKGVESTLRAGSPKRYAAP